MTFLNLSLLGFFSHRDQTCKFNTSLVYILLGISKYLIIHNKQLLTFLLLLVYYLKGHVFHSSVTFRKIWHNIQDVKWFWWDPKFIFRILNVPHFLQVPDRIPGSDISYWNRTGLTEGSVQLVSKEWRVQKKRKKRRKSNDFS